MKTATALLLVVAAAGGAALTPAAQTAAGERTAQTGTAPYVEALNLGFEAVAASGLPVNWYAGGDGYVAAIDTTESKDGRQSLRLAAGKLGPRPGSFGVATASFPVADARGGRLRLTGWIRTEAVTSGWAGLWMRVDGPGGVLSFDNMQRRGVTGTTPWTRYQIVLDVPRESTNINFGALLTGDGTAWVDALRFEVLPAAGPVRISGTVRDRLDRPLQGALVAVVAGMRVQRARSDAGGHYSVVTWPGDYAVTATAAGHTAGYVPPVAVVSDEVIDVRVGGNGCSFSGRVTDDAGAPAPGVPLRFARLSKDEGDLFLAESEVDGRYSVMVPPAERYQVDVDSPGWLAQTVIVEGAPARVLDLAVVHAGPAPTDVVDWIRRSAVALATVEAGHGFADMEPLRAIVGDARVVALGEATHGSREFFQLKHRMLEFLVERMGFTVFGIEANWPESLALDDYVVHGRGEARKGLAGMYFWTWNTEEVLALVEWMRQYNADPAHARKLRFYGFDMQTPTVAVERVVEYLRKVDPEHAVAAVEPLAPARDPNAYRTVEQLAKDRPQALKKAIRDLLARFDTLRGDYVARSSEAEWTLARQHLVVVRQAIDTMLPGTGPGRDESMAENVRWILDHEPAGTRMVLWAHNGHVSREGVGPARPMGAFLSESLGRDYAAFGFAFGRGSFQAMDWTRGVGQPGGLKEHTVGPPPPDTLDAAFSRTGLPLLALGLRQRDARGPLPTWLSAPRRMREIGAVFSSEDAMARTVVLPRAYDALFFVEQTTRARPIESAKPGTTTE